MSDAQQRGAVTEKVRGVDLLLVVLLCCAVALGIRQSWTMLDFTAFVCGGETVAQHANPYLREPLQQCETRRFLALGEKSEVGLTLPAPLPPYALAPFMLLSLLPATVAAGIYALLTVAAIVATVSLLRDMTQLPAAWILAAIAIPDIYVSLPLGQLVPCIIAAAVATAWSVERGKPVFAACAALITLMEPHLGLPICALLFCIERGRATGLTRGRRRARCALAATGAARRQSYVSARDSPGARRIRGAKRRTTQPDAHALSRRT